MLRSITTLDRIGPRAAGPRDEGHGLRRAARRRHPPARRGRPGDGMTDVADDAIRGATSPSEEAFRAGGPDLPARPRCRRRAARPSGAGLVRRLGAARVRSPTSGQLADAGLAGITWPAEYGGRGLPGRYQRIYDREAKAFQVPPRSLEIGLGMCGPTLLVHASEEQKQTLHPAAAARRARLVRAVQRARRRLGPLERADAGPARRRRVRARRARRCGRRAPSTATTPPASSGPTRRGPSARASPCSSSTCTCRASRCGRCARSPASPTSTRSSSTRCGCRWPTSSGEVDDGWRVARTMLAFERQALGNMGGGRRRQGRLHRAGRRGQAARPGRRGPVLRDRLVQLRIRQMVLRHLTGYLQVKAKGGDGAAASVLKLAMAQLVQESALVAVEMAGMHATRGRPTTPTAGAGRTSCSARCRPPSAAAPTRSCATSSPSACSACRGTRKATSCRAISTARGDARRRPARRAQERLVATEHPPAPSPREPGAGAQWPAGRRDRPVRRRAAGRHDLRRPRARRWSRSSGRAATRCAPTPPASPPGTGARRRSSSTCATPPGADALRDLVDEADLLVENLRPGALDRLGLAPATLRAGRPRLVTCSISAWGRTGRHATSRAGSRSCTPGPAHNRDCSPGTIRSGSPSPWPACRPRWWPSSAPAPR